jgi:hypothetical protein
MLSVRGLEALRPDSLNRVADLAEKARTLIDQRLGVSR